MEFWLRYDLRSPDFAAPTADIIEAALEQVAWADGKGFHTVQLSEHHGSPDNYNPAPLILASAVAARTKTLRINPPVMITLYDPVRFAEDCCLVDHVSRGRFDLTIGIGYVPSEFEMFGLTMKDRGRVADEKLAVVKSLFETGEFEYQDRRGKIRPLPYQPGGPKIYVGGAVKASARRAARFGDGFYPLDRNPELLEEYARACAEEGKPMGRLLLFSQPVFFHVAEDPDAAWAKIAPHAMHEANMYAQLAAAVGQVSPFPAAATADELRATGAYVVMTPDQCLAHCQAEHAAGRNLIFPPMMGGLSSDLAWESLELFAGKVLPTLKEQGIVTMP